MAPTRNIDNPPRNTYVEISLILFATITWRKLSSDPFNVLVLQSG